jgi:AcrR family transcriptional regulator
MLAANKTKRRSARVRLPFSNAVSSLRGRFGCLSCEVPFVERISRQTGLSCCEAIRQTRLSRVKILLMRTQKSSDPRNRILEVANHLFYAEGVRATGTEKIMSMAEVAKATFYRHFETKDALVLAYLENRDQALWDYLSQPTPPKDLREALTKLERMANSPETIGCPFLRIASEFPDTANPFHRMAIQHQNKIVDYLTGLLEPFAIDKRAAAAAILSVIDGALATRMVYGTSKKIPILVPAEAVLKSFQSARTQRGK